MNPIFIMIIVLIFILAVLIILLKSTKVPNAVYKNRIRRTDHAEKPSKPFFSAKYWLTGNPDYILHTKDGLIPLEIKNTNKPSKPYFSHVMQLIAYCILMEETYGAAPKYGFLQYKGSQPFSISYTQERKEMLLKALAEIKKCIQFEQQPDPNPQSSCRLHTLVRI